MCRLFGMTGGSEPVRATFWLIEAPDSLAQQSRREPDGTGLGTYDAQRRPVVSKQPIAAYQDRAFAQEAREVRSPTFLAHVRYASTGAVEARNTHPFEQRGRLLAHNGVIQGLDRLEEAVGDDMALVEGDTDSERFFALITRHAERAGDVGAGMAAAARWVAENLPVFALNVILTTATDLWALRYPDTHELYVLQRAAGGRDGDRGLHHASARGRIRAEADELAQRPAVIVASERMDDDPAWRLMDSGELLHVDAGLRCHSRRILDRPPAHPLALSDLDPHARSSQRPVT